MNFRINLQNEVIPDCGIAMTKPQSCRAQPKYELGPPQNNEPDLEQSQGHSVGTPAARTKHADIMITFKTTSTPPVYVAGSMTSPPWEPHEMSLIQKTSLPESHNENFEFNQAIRDVAVGEYQYKFRLGSAGLWVVDEHAEVGKDALSGCWKGPLMTDFSSVRDAQGNKNNLLIVGGDHNSPDVSDLASSARVVPLEGHSGTGRDHESIDSAEGVISDRSVESSGRKESLAGSPQEEKGYNAPIERPQASSTEKSDAVPRTTEQPQGNPESLQAKPPAVVFEAIKSQIDSLAEEFERNSPNSRLHRGTEQTGGPKGTTSQATGPEAYPSGILEDPAPFTRYSPHASEALLHEAEEAVAHLHTRLKRAQDSVGTEAQELVSRDKTSAGANQDRTSHG